MMLLPFSYGPHCVAAIVADFRQRALVVLGVVLEARCHQGVRWQYASLGSSVLWGSWFRSHILSGRE